MLVHPVNSQNLLKFLTQKMSLLFFCAALLLASANASFTYDSLYRGTVNIAAGAFPGTLYWRSDDSQWRSFGYHGIKYAYARRFEVSFF